MRWRCHLGLRKWPSFDLKLWKALSVDCDPIVPKRWELRESSVGTSYIMIKTKFPLLTLMRVPYTSSASLLRTERSGESSPANTMIGVWERPQVATKQSQIPSPEKSDLLAIFVGFLYRYRAESLYKPDRVYRLYEYTKIIWKIA